MPKVARKTVNMAALRIIIENRLRKAYEGAQSKHDRASTDHADKCRAYAEKHHNIPLAKLRPIFGDGLLTFSLYSDEVAVTWVAGALSPFSGTSDTGHRVEFKAKVALPAELRAKPASQFIPKDKDIQQAARVLAAEIALTNDGDALKLIDAQIKQYVASHYALPAPR